MSRRRENRDYGKIIDYDPLWKGPLQIERQTTDFGFLVALCIYIAVWIAVGLYAFSTGDMRSVKSDITDIQHQLDPGEADAINKSMSIAGGFTLLGIVLSFFYVFLLRHFPKAVVFTAIFAVCLALLVSICAFGYMMANGKGKDTSGATISFIMSIIVFIVIIVCLIIFRKKIIIACGVVKESTKAVIYFPSAFLFPLLPFVMYAITIAFSGYTLMYLSANPAMKNSNKNSNTPAHLYLFHGINFFGFLWAINFVYAFSQMVLSGTFATWYWTMDKERVPSFTILRFIHVTTRFHLGTLAFGSLIIAIVEAIKALFRALARNSRDGGNDLAALVSSCFGAMCQTVENLLEYINSNAYIMCTVHGTRFIQSAKDAFNLLMRNVMNVVVITNVTGAILFLGNVLVVTFSVLATYAYCHNMNDEVKTSAMVIVGVTTLILSVCIFEVLKTAINTIFLCVLEDYERNDGSNERPYFMPYKLRQLLIQDE